jgi:tetratricopeptide (TPR) repeat protein
MDALEAVGVEIENVRLTWQLAVARGDVEALGRSLGSLGTFYAIRSWHQEGVRAFSQATERLAQGQSVAPSSGQREIVLGALLAWQGHFVYQLGRYDEAQRLLEQSLNTLNPHGVRREKAFSLYTLAQIQCFGLNDYQEAEKLFQESLALYEILEDRYGRAQALDGLGDVAARQGKHDEARRCYETGLALRREIGDRWGISVSLGSLGGLAGRLGDYDEARQRFEESLTIGRGLENPQGIAASLHNLSTVAYLQGDYVEAKRLRLETLEICREIGYRWGVASALKSLGDVACRLGKYDEARRFLQESLDILKETGDRRSQAYTLNSLGTVEQTMGNHAASQEHFQQSLAAAMEIQEQAIALAALKSIAELLAGDGDIEQALELWAFVVHHSACEQQTRSQIEALQTEFRSQLPSEAAAQADARGRILDLNDVAAKVLTSQ